MKFLIDTRIKRYILFQLLELNHQQKAHSSTICLDVDFKPPLADAPKEFT